MTNQKPRIAVLYHYFETQNSIISIINILCKAYSKDIDFYISIAGGSSLNLPDQDNIKYFYVENDSFDYGGFSRLVNNELKISLYDYFIFINSSCAGPYLPSYYKESWTRPFLDLLVGDVVICGPMIDIMSLNHKYSTAFGSVYNIPPPHCYVSSCCYAMTREALAFLKKIRFYKLNQHWNKDEAIVYYEMNMSMLLLKNNWNIASFLPGYQNIDYRKLKAEDIANYNLDIPFRSNGYFGRNLSPIETMFHKINMHNSNFQYVKQTFDVVNKNLADKGSAYENAINMPIITINSEWKDYSNLVRWLMEEIEPNIIVNLSLRDCFPTLLFSLYSDQQKCRVFCINSLNNLETIESNNLDIIKTKAVDLSLKNILVAKNESSEHSAYFDNKVDILYIDRLDSYKLIEDDYNQWYRSLKENGVILLHNTCAPERHARMFFDQIKLPKLNIKQSKGLGIITRNTGLLERIRKIHFNMLE